MSNTSFIKISSKIVKTSKIPKTQTSLVWFCRKISNNFIGGGYKKIDKNIIFTYEFKEDIYTIVNINLTYY